MTSAPLSTEKQLLISQCVYLLDDVPVKDVVVGEPLAMEKVSYQLTKVRVIRFFLEAKRATIVQVS